jgi:hypothetical protein
VRIILIASYASFQRGGAGCGVSRDCGIGFGFLEDLDFTRELVSSFNSVSSSFAVRDVLCKLLEGVPRSERSERSESSEDLESTSSLIRFDGFGLGDRDVDG